MHIVLPAGQKTLKEKLTKAVGTNLKIQLAFYRPVIVFKADSIVKICVKKANSHFPARFFRPPWKFGLRLQRDKSTDVIKTLLVLVSLHNMNS